MTDFPDKTSFLAELVNAYKIGEKNDSVCHDTYRTDCKESLDFFP